MVSPTVNLIFFFSPFQCFFCSYRITQGEVFNLTSIYIIIWRPNGSVRLDSLVVLNSLTNSITNTTRSMAQWQVREKISSFPKTKTAKWMKQWTLSILSLKKHCQLHSYPWTMRSRELGSPSSCSITPWHFLYLPHHILYGASFATELSNICYNTGEGSDCRRAAKRSSSLLPTTKQNKTIHLKMSWHPIKMLTKRLQRVDCELSTAQGNLACSCLLNKPGNHLFFWLVIASLYGFNFLCLTIRWILWRKGTSWWHC